jgi:hypothetical protein
MTLLCIPVVISAVGIGMPIMYGGCTGRLVAVLGLFATAHRLGKACEIVVRRGDFLANLSYNSELILVVTELFAVISGGFLAQDSS